ncbi:hypothetical protein [Catenuloplanes atrovinosus]|uniref:Nucleic acid-binding Zn-ribbon protein n=1 Tax=Catenuloplanes atrovinosus TaxID=137266 RepID=A0AAE3YSR1_9ACTN|nr:hypothetical protein [Catenuloplanes atrovinosus]MDR7278960.1 putative nucleic acid-binding Zn-ribbon protein [Catenuloplanes atrovinosus]
MDIETLLGGLAAAWRFARAHEDAVMVAAGVVLVLCALVAMKRADRKTGRPDRVLRRWLGLAILGFSAEGMWEVATEDLTLGRGLALIFFAIGDVAIIGEMITAEKSRLGSIKQRKHLRAVWTIATILGAIVACSADTPVEIPLRFVLPLLAVWVWKLGLQELGENEVIERDENALTWMIGPWLRQRVIALRLAKPGKADLETIDRAQLIDRLTRLRFRLWKAERDGNTTLVTRLTARWHRLTLDADDAMLAEVTARVQRTLVAEARTRPLTAEQVDQLAVAEQSAAAAAAAARDTDRQHREALAAIERQQQAIAAAVAAAEEAQRQRQADARQAAAEVAALQRQIEQQRQDAAAAAAEQRRAVEAAEAARRQDAAAAQRLVAELRQAADAAAADRREAVAEAGRQAERQVAEMRRLLEDARREAAARGAQVDQLTAELVEARTRPARRTSAEETAARVAAYRVDHPDATQQAVADALGLGVRTVRTYWSAPELAEAAR